MPLDPDRLTRRRWWTGRSGYEKAVEKYQGETTREREEVLAVGGLFILGTERHESRRIDNQLRGRAGRQGDPGVASSSSRSRTT